MCHMKWSKGEEEEEEHSVDDEEEDEEKETSAKVEDLKPAAETPVSSLSWFLVLCPDFCWCWWRIWSVQKPEEPKEESEPEGEQRRDKHLSESPEEGGELWNKW